MKHVFGLYPKPPSTLRIICQLRNAVVGSRFHVIVVWFSVLWCERWWDLKKWNLMNGVVGCCSQKDSCSYKKTGACLSGFILHTISCDAILHDVMWGAITRVSSMLSGLSALSKCSRYFVIAMENAQ
jgi:hypothetical protein